ncbi:hypothetical protein BAJUN_02070 [Bajunvirus bajun]|uniref:Uncharacterized protein n=1 Tax=Brevundimonas phage vB_BgoS-Bajun TaxID=2948594 RepID=A0A9E7N765_9CAUD|nr:hypothetical protein BAJUN_02070 [Brevundimonas phage vB_BgoS-Bajun]
MADGSLHIARPTLAERQKTIMSSYAGWSAQRVANELLSRATTMLVEAGEINAKVERVDAEIKLLEGRRRELQDHQDELTGAAERRQKDAMIVSGLDIDAPEAAPPGDR